MTHATDMLAKAEAALAAFNERHFPTGRKFDHGMLNTPLRSRGNIDAQLDQYKALSARVDYWRTKVDLEHWRKLQPGIREAKQHAHDSANLKARYGDCTEVMWTFTGGWLPVIRWNAKSVTVDMGGSRESIPHDQVGGAR